MSLKLIYPPSQASQRIGVCLDAGGTWILSCRGSLSLNSCPSGRCALSDRTPGQTNIPFVDLGEGISGLDSGGLGGAFAGTPYRVGDDAVCTGVSTGAADPASAVTRSSAAIHLILDRHEDSLPDLDSLMESLSSIYTGGDRFCGGTEAVVKAVAGSGTDGGSSGFGDSESISISSVGDIGLLGSLTVFHILSEANGAEVRIEISGSPDGRMVRCRLLYCIVM